MRCKVEHAFRIIKCQFGYEKTVERGLKQNETRLSALFACANLSDPATEDAIYDSYDVRKFTGIDFMTEAVPDETTLLTAAPAVFPGSVTTRLTGSVISKTANPRCAAK